MLTLKKPISILLSVLLIFGIFAVVPFSAMASETVAAIGETAYTSLKEAFEAAQNGDTITVTASHEFAESAVLKSGIDITLDLNGNNITYTGADYAFMLNQAKGGKFSRLTVNNAADVTATQGGVFQIFMNNTLTVNGGNFTAAKEVVHQRQNSFVSLFGGRYTSQTNAIHTFHSTSQTLVEDAEISSVKELIFVGEATLKNVTSNAQTSVFGKVTFTGGTHITFEGNYGLRVYGGGSARIDDAVFDGNVFNSSDNDKTHLVITGGIFKKGLQPVDKHNHQLPCNYTVEGGTFYVNPEQFLDTENYEVVPETDADGKTVYVVVTKIKFQAKLALEDNINIKFYVNDVPKNTELGKYTVEYTFKDVTNTAFLTDYEQSEIVVAECAAKEMTEPVDITVSYDGQPIKEIKGYSVQTYCEKQIEKDGSTDELKALCKAILSYGSGAQKIFDYKTDNLADAKYGDVYTDAVPDTFKAVSTGSCQASVKANLALESRTELHFYFKAADGAVVTHTLKDSEGNDVFLPLIVRENGQKEIVISDIAAKNLDKAYTLTLSDGTNTKTVTYSPLSYAYSKQSVQGMESVAKQLYHYWETAKAYFNTVNA